MQELIITFRGRTAEGITHRHPPSTLCGKVNLNKAAASTNRTVTAQAGMANENGFQ